MKFNKAKCRVSHIRRNNPRHQNTLGSNRLEISFAKEDLGVLGNNKLKHAPLSSTLGEDERGRTHIKNHEIPPENKKTFFFFFFCEDGQTLEQVAQRGCEASTCGAIQSMTAGPGQPALGGPACAGQLNQMASRGLFPPQPSCDSVTTDKICLVHPTE